MIPIKIFGCAVTVFFSSCLGMYFSNAETRKLRVCEEIYAFVLKLEYGTAKRIPINGIIKEYTLTADPGYITGNCREEIITCLCETEKNGICPIPSKLCRELLIAIGKSPDGVEIQKNCSETAERIKNVLSDIRSECKAKKELYVKLGIILGILMCVTFI